ncbi:hypothetical protein FHS75_000119 [Novosphingobium marinum]|uniref:Uncharacterized protein n=1 Tax=Novosphingobium marinum TaxID=1514948 RepID=A0A7Z0BS56_9SPHN|nr:hypothetical protein [Novosphingobium marinum]
MTSYVIWFPHAPAFPEPGFRVKPEREKGAKFAPSPSSLFSVSYWPPELAGLPGQ